MSNKNTMKLLHTKNLCFRQIQNKNGLGDRTKGLIRTIFKGLCIYEKKSRSVKDEHVWANSEVTKKI